MKKSKVEILLDRWLGHQFSSGSIAGEDYLKFQRESKRVLKELAGEAGYDLYRFNPNHYCFSAVLQQIEGGAFAYVSASDVRFGKDEWATHLLYRQMKHEEDWTGGPNHYCSMLELPASLRALYS